MLEKGPRHVGHEFDEAWQAVRPHALQCSCSCLFQVFLIWDDPLQSTFGPIFE